MKVILITGASRGIGMATALLLAKQGYGVAINYQKNQVAAEKVVINIKGNGGTAIALKADISKEKEIIRMFAECDRLLGPIYGLVNNAGILEKQMRVEEMNMERLQRILATNVAGQIICAREAIRRMSLKHGGKGGVIVNISSIAARTGSPGEYVDYAASKGSIDTFTIGLSKEVAEEGIRVNAVRPAFINTDIHADGGEPGRVERIKNSIPIKRGGLADEVAEAVLWLISEKSSYTTGTFINVSGGM
ncbi:SDR family oxidoreductase [Catalinimonas sp. 4WD22]|uniref:SDR family oxidoreductase n=1 Tax=Catalinimonas locisalis TaxID=3133978 RepID=UPI003100F72C